MNKSTIEESALYYLARLSYTILNSLTIAPKSPRQSATATMLPASIAQKIGETVIPLMQMIRLNSEQNMSFASTRNALLPKLLSSSFGIKEDQNIFEELA